MSSNMELLYTRQVCVGDKNVHLLNEDMVNVSHTGSYDVMND